MIYHALLDDRNLLHADGDCRRPVTFSNFFHRNFQNLDFHCHIWIQLEICIKMRTNMPSIGAVVLEITSWILIKSHQFFFFFFFTKTLAGVASKKDKINCVIFHVYSVYFEHLCRFQTLIFFIMIIEIMQSVHFRKESIYIF